MAATGYTPISLYYSATASAVPLAANLANGEVALNTADMKLYAKNSSGVVTLLASNAASATSGTSILYGNGSGGFSNVTIGSGVSFAGGTLSATGSGGSVTSVAVSGGTTGLTTSGGPITTSGTITLAGTLATANGGTNLTSFTSGGVVYASSSSVLATGSALTFNGTSLGISATPSAWSASYRTLQSGTGSAFVGFNGNDQTFVVSNAYNNGTNWIYRNTSGAGYYGIQGISSGVHAWFTAPSGTAGTAITFTQAMTLDASGNLLVGGTSTLTGGSRKALTLNSAAGQLSIVEFGVNGTLGGYIYSNASQLTLSANNSSPMSFETGGSERLRIALTGAFGLSGANYGTSGQVLTSAGSSSAPTWSTPAGGGSQAFVAFGSTGGL